MTGCLAVIRTLGALVGAGERAEALARSYAARLGAASAASAGRTQPRVYFEEWDAPMPERPSSKS